MHECVVLNLPTSAPFDWAGGFGGSTMPAYRTFTQAVWNDKNWTAGLSHTFVPSVTDQLAVVMADPDSFHSFDLRFSSSFAGSGNKLLQGLRGRLA